MHANRARRFECYLPDALHELHGALLPKPQSGEINNGLNLPANASGFRNGSIGAKRPV